MAKTYNYQWFHERDSFQLSVNVKLKTIRWFKKKKIKLLLAPLARKFLALPMISTPSERTFSHSESCQVMSTKLLLSPSITN